MRVIGNNKMVDIPYERSTIYYHGDLKQLRADCSAMNEYILKRNVESDEAKEILSEIRTAYTMGRKIYEIPEKG